MAKEILEKFFIKIEENWNISITASSKDKPYLYSNKDSIFTSTNSIKELANFLLATADAIDKDTDFKKK